MAGASPINGAAIMKVFSNLLTDAKAIYSRDKKISGIWAAFMGGAFFVYFFMSSGDFSFLLTLASLWRCFGLSLLIYKVYTGMSARGVSVKTLELYAVAFLARLLSIMRHQGYLPFDKTGDWFYHVVEFISLGAVGLLLFGIFGPLKSTYDSKYDKFGNYKIPAEYGALYLFVPCLIMALIFHPQLNKEMFSDTCWTLSMYVEAIAMVPQLYMFQKQASDQDGTVEAVLSHTTFAIGFSRIFELFFWIGSFHELSNSTGKFPGYIILLSQFTQLVIMGDFFYYYFQSVSTGGPMELPTYNSMNV